MDRIAQVSWKSPSNIAFIKYWGKYGEQMPQNPSLSMTLDKCFTETKVELFKKETEEEIEINFLFEGKENKAFSDRVYKYFDQIKDKISFLPNYRLDISSSNSFPHSAGIASSASAMSALALCIATIEQRLGNKFDGEFYRWASDIARLGSGSASRSLFSEFVVWGESKDVFGSSDNYATKLNIPIHRDFKCLRDVVLILDDEQKKVSSSAGHSLMKGHPFADSRFTSARTNLTNLLSAMRLGDFDQFATVLENEALSLHAMMMTAKPWYTLLSPNSLVVMEKVKQFRADTKVKLTFTLDAGPNVHLIFPAEEEEKVKPFIMEELVKYCSKERYIIDNIGTGPELLIDEFD